MRPPRCGPRACPLAPSESLRAKERRFDSSDESSCGRQMGLRPASGPAPGSAAVSGRAPGSRTAGRTGPRTGGSRCTGNSAGGGVRPTWSAQPARGLSARRAQRAVRGRVCSAHRTLAMCCASPACVNADAREGQLHGQVIGRRRTTRAPDDTGRTAWQARPRLPSKQSHWRLTRGNGREAHAAPRPYAKAIEPNDARA